MTHGDKAKAKTAKSSQASAAKKTSSKASAKAAQGGKGRNKEAVQAGPESGKGKKQQAGGQKGSTLPKKGAATPQETSSDGKGKTGKQAAGKQAAGKQAPETPGGFSNPVISAAFKRAVKKYPNALRKLTD